MVASSSGWAAASSASSGTASGAALVGEAGADEDVAGSAELLEQRERVEHVAVRVVEGDVEAPPAARGELLGADRLDAARGAGSSTWRRTRRA